MFLIAQVPGHLLGQRPFQPLIDQRGRPGWWPSDLRGTIAVSDITCPSASRIPAAHRQATSLAQPAGDAPAAGMNNTSMYVISAILVLMVVRQIREQQFHLRTLAGGGTRLWDRLFLRSK